MSEERDPYDLKNRLLDQIAGKDEAHFVKKGSKGKAKSKALASKKEYNPFGISKKSREAWKKGGEHWQNHMKTIK